jgi:hypothetical protein
MYNTTFHVPTVTVTVERDSEECETGPGLRGG